MILKWSLNYIYFNQFQEEKTIGMTVNQWHAHSVLNLRKKKRRRENASNSATEKAGGRETARTPTFVITITVHDVHTVLYMMSTVERKKAR